MSSKLSLGLVALLSLGIVQLVTLSSHPIAAQQPPQKEDQSELEAQLKEQQKAWIKEMEKADRKFIKEMEVTYPALYKIKPLSPKDDELRKLQVERYHAAMALVSAYYRQFMVGTATPGGGSPFGPLFEAEKLFMNSRLDLVEKPEEEIAVREDWVKATKKFEEIGKVYSDAGKGILALLQARHERSDADIQLLKAKRKLQK
jgi:hypothetical protein